MKEYKINNKESLENFITHNWNEVNDYIDHEFDGLPTPIYTSVDIRESRTKFAPVDNNIYPAGFNNICALDLDCATTTFKKTILKYDPNVKTVGILPESHTKNTFYLDHLGILKKALSDGEFRVIIFSVDEQLFTEMSTIDLVSASGYDVQIKKAILQDGYFYVEGEKIDFTILNHDQSSPLNIDWNSVKTPVHPGPIMGWYNRSKSGHFIQYRKVIEKFSEKYSINPYLIEADFRLVENIDFGNKEGIENLASAVDELKSKSESPVVFIKGDQGTYGMGISVVTSGEDVLNFNRKDRNKMDIGKNKIKFTSVIVQEGVETILKYDNMPAEVTIYLIGGKSVGGFMRANTEKGSQDNLNAKGMVFRKFCISEIRQNNDYQAKEAIYSIIARLSNLAGAYEKKEKLNKE